MAVVVIVVAVVVVVVVVIVLAVVAVVAMVVVVVVGIFWCRRCSVSARVPVCVWKFFVVTSVLCSCGVQWGSPFW